jgi:hypothetical protein
MVEEKKGLVENAAEVAAKLEAANKQFEDLLKKKEELMAREMLAGRSTASNTVVEDPAEAKKKAALDFWKGSQIENILKKHG